MTTVSKLKRTMSKLMAVAVLWAVALRAQPAKEGTLANLDENPTYNHVTLGMNEHALWRLRYQSHEIAVTNIVNKGHGIEIVMVTYYRDPYEPRELVGVPLNEVRYKVARRRVVGIEIMSEPTHDRFVYRGHIARCLAHLTETWGEPTQPASDTNTRILWVGKHVIGALYPSGSGNEFALTIKIVARTRRDRSGK